MKKYYLKDIDVSQLPLPLRESIIRKNKLKEMSPDGAPVAMVGYLEKHVEPFPSKLYEGEYFTYWILSADDKLLDKRDFGGFWFMVVKTPWVSPRIDKYLENILINKEQVL